MEVHIKHSRTVKGRPQQMEDGSVLEPLEPINVNAQTIGGETPLMKAAGHGNVSICEAIILAGAGLFLVDKRNRRAD